MATTINLKRKNLNLDVLGGTGPKKKPEEELNVGNYEQQAKSYKKAKEVTEQEDVLSNYERQNLIKKLSLAGERLTSVKNSKLNLTGLQTKKDYELKVLYERVKSVHCMQHPLDTHLAFVRQALFAAENIAMQYQSVINVRGLAERLNNNNEFEQVVTAYSLINADCSENSILWNMCSIVGNEVIKNHVFQTEEGKKIELQLKETIGKEMIDKFAML
jgi:hypothetical protein